MKLPLSEAPPRRALFVGLACSLLVHLAVIGGAFLWNPTPAPVYVKRGEPLMIDIAPERPRERAPLGSPSEMPAPPPVPAAPRLAEAPPPGPPAPPRVEAPRPEPPAPPVAEVPVEPPPAPRSEPPRVARMPAPRPVLRPSPPPAPRAPEPPPAAETLPPAPEPAPRMARVESPAQEPPALAPPAPPPPAEARPPLPDELPPVPPPAAAPAEPPPMARSDQPVPSGPGPIARAPEAGGEEQVARIPPQGDGGPGLGRPRLDLPAAMLRRSPGGGLQGGTGGVEGDPVPLDTPDPKYKEYFDLVREQIRRNWGYPREAADRGIEGQLLIEFHIAKGGALEYLELRRTSGVRVLDEYAMNAIRLAQPFPPVPDPIAKHVLAISGLFRYQIVTGSSLLNQILR